MYGVRQLCIYIDDKQQIGKFIGDFQAPIDTGLKLTVQILQNLTGGNNCFFPGSVQVGQLLTDFVWLCILMIDVEEYLGIAFSLQRLLLSTVSQPSGGCSSS
jgi:hypothetical protein